jgi:hypothetical protein
LEKEDEGRREYGKARKDKTNVAMLRRGSNEGGEE